MFTYAISSQKAVADSVDRDNIAMLTACFNLASQVGNVNVDGAVHTIVIGTKGASE